MTPFRGSTVQVYAPIFPCYAASLVPWTVVLSYHNPRSQLNKSARLVALSEGSTRYMSLAGEPM